MSAHVMVERVIDLPAWGPIAVGILTRGTVSVGDSMLVPGSATVVVVRGLEFHVPQPETGRRVGLLLRPEDATAVTAGSTLVTVPEA